MSCLPTLPACRWGGFFFPYFFSLFFSILVTCAFSGSFFCFNFIESGALWHYSPAILLKMTPIFP